MSWNNKAPIRSVQDYGVAVARGDVQGASAFGGVGRLVTAGAVSNNILWPNGAFFIPDQVTGAAISFVSSSAEDAVGGTGVSKVEVHYLDVDLVPRQAQITLEGLTPVTGQLSGVRFIQCMHVIEVGSDLAANGLVEAYLAASPTTVYSLIAAGEERCTSSMRMIPAGKRLLINAALGSSISGTAAAGTTIELIASELDNHQYLDPFIFIPQPSLGLQDGSESSEFPVPLVFNAGTVAGMRVSTDKAAIITGDWFGIIESAGV